MAGLGDLIYTPEKAAGEALSKVESHTPRIRAPDTVRKGEAFEVEVAVGPHPNTAEHSIRRVELYFREEGRAFNPIRLVSVELEPGYSEPRIKISLRLNRPGTLYATAYCNLHGIWESSLDIKVI